MFNFQSTLPVTSTITSGDEYNRQFEEEGGDDTPNFIISKSPAPSGRSNVTESQSQRNFTENPNKSGRLKRKADYVSNGAKKSFNEDLEILDTDEDEVIC